MILLDTNAIIWLATGHPRAAPVQAGRMRLAISPVSLLELQFLAEVGRLGLVPGSSLRALAADRRWRLDDPPSKALFDAALDQGVTRDPFDRLLLAHASLRRWRLATGDRMLLDHLDPALAVAL